MSGTSGNISVTHHTERTCSLYSWATWYGLPFVNVFYTVSQKNDTKNDTDVTHYRFNPHQPISVIFGRDVAERVLY